MHRHDRLVCLNQETKGASLITEKDRKGPKRTEKDRKGQERTEKDRNGHRKGPLKQYPKEKNHIISIK